MASHPESALGHAITGFGRQGHEQADAKKLPRSALNVQADPMHLGNLKAQAQRQAVSLNTAAMRGAVKALKCAGQSFVADVRGRIFKAQFNRVVTLL